MVLLFSMHGIQVPIRALLLKPFTYVYDFSKDQQDIGVSKHIKYRYKQREKKVTVLKSL